MFARVLSSPFHLMALTCIKFHCCSAILSNLSPSEQDFPHCKIQTKSSSLFLFNCGMLLLSLLSLSSISEAIAEVNFNCPSCEDQGNLQTLLHRSWNKKKKSKTNVKQTSNLKILAGYSVYMRVCKSCSWIIEMIITFVHLMHLFWNRSGWKH